jgi:phage protein U
MNESRLRRAGLIAGALYGIVFLFVCAILIGSALSLKSNVIYHWTDLRPVETLSLTRTGQPEGSVTLPATLYPLAPGERVTLTTTLETTIHDNLLVKTTGAPLQLYVNDSLSLSVGLEGT